MNTDDVCVVCGNTKNIFNKVVCNACSWTRHQEFNAELAANNARVLGDIQSHANKILAIQDLFGHIHLTDTYQEYIQSPRWKKKREAELVRSGYRCGLCGLSKLTVKLSVHHLTYDRFGNEPPEDLIVLCEKCHAEQHLWNSYYLSV